MTQIAKTRTAFKRPVQLPPKPFRTIDVIPLGNHARLAVQVGVSGGARVLNLRNEMAQSGGMLPAGPGAIVGVDGIPALIEILQAVIAPQAVVA